MQNFESLCILLNSGDQDEISQAQNQINNLVENMPITELIDFLSDEISNQSSSIYLKFTSMIMLSQIDLTDIDIEKLLVSVFTILSTDNISLRNSAIKLYSKCFIYIINSINKDDSDSFFTNIIGQLTDKIPASNSDEFQINLHQSIISILFNLLDYYQNNSSLSIFICSYLFQHMIEMQQNGLIIMTNHFIYLFSLHISFLFKIFLTEEQINVLFTFIRTLIEDDNYKNTIYSFILKITEFDYQLLYPIIDIFFETSLNDLSEQKEEYEITIFNIYYLIFKKDRNSHIFESSISIVFDAIEIFLQIIENEKIEEIRFETEWNESIACYKCLKCLSKYQNSITTTFFIEYLTKNELNFISLLLVQIIVTSSPHEFVNEHIIDFLSLIDQSLALSSENESIDSNSIVFIQFSAIKCLRKMVKFFPENLPLFSQFVEGLISFIENDDEVTQLVALSTLSQIFSISLFEEKEKYINLIFENIENLPPFTSSHAIDSLKPIISTIDEPDFFIQTIPIVLKLITEAKDEVCFDSLLCFLQIFIVNAGESISPFIPTIMTMLLQFIVENHSVVSILAIGSVSFVSSPELVEPFIYNCFNILYEIIINDGMDDKSVRNQCLSSLSLIASKFDLSEYLGQIFELTLRIIQNIELNEWNDFDFSSSAFLIDLYVSLIRTQNEIDESILSNIFEIISHQNSSIDLNIDDDGEIIEFSEISLFLETSTKFITLIFIYYTDFISDDIFNMAMELIDNATQLPSVNISMKETIYDFYKLLSQNFPSQFCEIFSQNQNIESFIREMMSSNEFIIILSNKALGIQQK